MPYAVCCLCANSLGNSLDIHAGLLLVGIEVDPIAREDDLGVYLGAREAGDRGNATAGCGLRMEEKDELAPGMVSWNGGTYVVDEGGA